MPGRVVIYCVASEQRTVKFLADHSVVVGSRKMETKSSFP